MPTTHRELIVCAACSVRVDPDLIAEADLVKLRAGLAASGEAATGNVPDTVAAACPWCGAGPLVMSHTEEAAEETFSFYYPLGRSADGTIDIQVKDWDADTISLASMEVAPDAPDYAFWSWIADRPRRFPRLNDDQLPAAREEFSAWQRGWLPWAWYRLTHRRRNGWKQSLRALEG